MCLKDHQQNTCFKLESKSASRYCDVVVRKKMKTAFHKKKIKNVGFKSITNPSLLVQ